MVRVRESAGNLVLIDAREPGPLMDDINAAGLDIDQGMVLVVGERMYYGSDAIHALAIMGTRSGIFNRLTYWCFRSRKISGVLYPVLRAGRNLLLKILGRTKVNNLGLSDNERF
jgi:hypothetical protein